MKPIQLLTVFIILAGCGPNRSMIRGDKAITTLEQDTDPADAITIMEPGKGRQVLQATKESRK